MLPFQDATPTPAGDWRHIVRFGRNVASYKFALGRVLLDLAAQQQTFVRLEDLSLPYAASICEHLLAEDRQSTSARSRFLDACRSRNRGELDAAQLPKPRSGSASTTSSTPSTSAAAATPPRRASSPTSGPPGTASLCQELYGRPFCHILASRRMRVRGPGSDVSGRCHQPSREKSPPCSATRSLPGPIQRPGTSSPNGPRQPSAPPDRAFARREAYTTTRSAPTVSSWLVSLFPTVTGSPGAAAWLL
jgi:hypothetical protein